MTDSRLRVLERQWQATGTVDAHAAWLRERVRAGLLPRVELEVAAARGDAASARVARELPRALLVVEFWAVWNHRHDQVMTRALGELQVPDFEWLLHRVDIDEFPELATTCKVVNIPTLVAFRAGVERGRAVGLRSADDLTTWLRTTWVGLPYP